MYKILKIKKATEYIFSYVKSDYSLKKDAVRINFNEKFKYQKIAINKQNNSYLIYNMDYKFLTIPEGFVLYKALKKKDGIYLIKNKNYHNLLIIKNNILIEDTYIYNQNATITNIIKYKYNLNVYNIQNYSQLLKKGLKTLHIKDLLSFIQISYDKNNLKNYFKIFSISFLLSTVIIYIIIFIYKIFLQKKYTNISEKYQIISKKSFLLNKKIKIIKNEYKKYILLKKFTQQKQLNALNELAIFAYKNHYKIPYIRINDNNILFLIDSNNTNVLSKILNLKLIKNVQYQSSININKNVKRYRFEGSL